MRETFLTRHDTDVGEGEFDSIAWAMETHVDMIDDGKYQSAILYGNEDDPKRIDFYTEENPRVDTVPAFVWPV